jgi:hypothetical protein
VVHGGGGGDDDDVDYNDKYVIGTRTVNFIMI